MIVCTPATSIVTSSAAPGSSGFDDQFVTTSQKLVPAVQLTPAERAGFDARKKRTQAIEPIPDRWNALRMVTLLATRATFAA